MMLEYNLQFFANDDKTEPATAKKLSDARKEGSVAKSREVANGLGLLSVFLIIKIWAGRMGIQFLNAFDYFYNRIAENAVFWNGDMPRQAMAVLFRVVMVEILSILAPFLIIGVLVAFLSDIWQVKWAPTTKPLQPKLSKLSPLSGFKRIFSTRSLVELAKSILKIFLIGYMAYSFLKDKLLIIFSFFDMPLLQAIAFIGDTVADLGIRISAAYMIIAVLDYAYQKWKFAQDMKMTKQEVKDEFKNAEGDPQIKGQIRARMRQASQRRMMKALSQADVVITNPTHYAVAIKYDNTIADAPVVIAKGEGYLAQRIKDVAAENDIEIVENKPLARMLYANVDIDETIPEELYAAVAEVLAYVYKLKGKI